MMFGMEELEWQGYVMVNNEVMFSGVDRIPACDRRTGKWTDILRQHSPRYVYASHGKNVPLSTCSCSLLPLAVAFLASILLYIIVLLNYPIKPTDYAIN